MAGGRPTKYSHELVDRAREYLQEGYVLQNEVVPTQEGLSYWLKISRTTIKDWAKEDGKEEFSAILEECNQKQAFMLMGGSLRGDMNANIAKLMLGKHGYSERHQSEISGIDGAPIKSDVNLSATVTINDIKSAVAQILGGS